MIELLFVSHQTNYDIIYIFLVVDNFLHLFGNLSQHWLHESWLFIAETILFQANLGF
jgi:hypothetical protein